MEIRYGYSLPNHFWAYTGRMTKAPAKVHITDTEEFQTTALCGVTVLPGVEHTSGPVCPRCRRLAGLRSEADLVRDEQEASWMEAQLDG